MMFPPMPPELLDRLRWVFAESNRRLATCVSAAPKVLEESLDHQFILGLAMYEVPRTFSFGWTVSLRAEFVGGASRFHSGYGGLEVADVAIIFEFWRAGRFDGAKAAFLQSKRLYPNTRRTRTSKKDRNQARSISAPYGASRLFEFTTNSTYGALDFSNSQYSHMELFRERRGISLYYLLYNPLRLPRTIGSPTRARRLPRDPCIVGCRVVPQRDMYQVKVNVTPKTRPTYSDLTQFLPPQFRHLPNQAGWRLEDFVVNEILGCNEGAFSNDLMAGGFVELLYEREYPISVVVVVAIDAPEG